MGRTWRSDAPYARLAIRRSNRSRFAADASDASDTDGAGDVSLFASAFSSTSSTGASAGESLMCLSDAPYARLSARRRSASLVFADFMDDDVVDRVTDGVAVVVGVVGSGVDAEATVVVFLVPVILMLRSDAPYARADMKRLTPSLVGARGVAMAALGCIFAWVCSFGE
ncbi:hypothetical protein DFJ73DRAFT_807552 [Zopfochytrium polystomum]|nr:hypothetical protein DFJ73DRAFT_807552 [Zopfochytrium polystomum]